MRRDIVWERLDRPGLEHLVLETGTDGISAESLLLLDDESGLIKLRYRLVMTKDWRTHLAAFDLAQGRTRRTLEIARDGGGWKVDGAARSDLAGADDIDISGTPLTNTQAIKQLGLESCKTKSFRIAYVKLPSLAVAAISQDYTRLDPGEPPRRFRYTSPGFTAGVDFDDDGLVVDYPPGWKRRTK